MLPLLEEKVEQVPEEDRVVSLMADEISIKELCSYDPTDDRIIGIKKLQDGSLSFPATALFFMVSGLRMKWRQAVAFFFK